MTIICKEMKLEDIVNNIVAEILIGSIEYFFV